MPSSFGENAIPPLKVADNFHVSIPTAALGKKYLISASIIPQSTAATSKALAGKVVEFQLYHDGVDLYESADGLVVTKDLPVRRLLSTFPIVSKDDTKVVIDFNKGMQRVFTSIWYDTSGRFSIADRDEALEIPHGRVFSAESKGDQLVIQQAIQARSRASRQNTESRYEVRYFITPYVPNKFEGKEHTAAESRYLRFFEIQAQLDVETGRPTTKVALFDLEKPLAFYYSGNTPEDYVEAVKKGVLYWNKVFGKEIVKCEAAPEGVTAPSARHNMVQWVPWEHAGFAYADILIDPQSGESIRGQAYMTSVFAIASLSRARALLRLMRSYIDTDVVEETEEEPEELHFHGWPSASLCRVDARHYAKEFAEGLEDILANEKLTDDIMLKFSQFYVIHVVAHEVGHILGLRHNFAGSLDGNMTHRD
ncbi:MAG: zinc-dependent metalloprotease, partial [Verrucomicrobiota bacterium]